MSLEHDSSEAELNAIAAALGSLVPSRSRTDRDRVMFLAGQAAARPSFSGRRAWIAIAASLALVASVEATMLLRPPVPRIVDRVIVVREPAAPPSSPSLTVPEKPPAVNTFVLGRTARDLQVSQLSLYGLDGLPAPHSAARNDSEPSRSSSRKSLREELRKDLDLGDS